MYIQINMYICVYIYITWICSYMNNLLVVWFFFSFNASSASISALLYVSQITLLRKTDYELSSIYTLNC